MIKTKRMQQIEQTHHRSIEVLMADLYVGQGLPAEEIARRLAIHESLVTRYVRLCGLPVRPRGRPSHKPQGKKVPRVSAR